MVFDNETNSGYFLTPLIHALLEKVVIETE